MTASTITMSTEVHRMTAKGSRCGREGLRSFTVKVQKARTRRGKQYYVLRVTIPKAVQHKLHVRPNDYLFLLAEQAKWYHLVDWTKMPETLQRLPDDLRKVLAASKLIPT